MVSFTEKKDIFMYKLRLNGIKDDVAEMLWNVYELVYFTDFSSDKIKMALINEYTYAQVAEKYGLEEGTIKKEVFDFNNKIEESTCIDITKLVENNFEIDKEEREKINSITKELISRYSKGIKREFTINIFDGLKEGEDFSDISEDEFLNLRSKLVLISLEAQKFIIENFDKRLLRYGAFLLLSENGDLTETDLRRKEEIMLFTKIKK